MNNFITSLFLSILLAVPAYAKRKPVLVGAYGFAPYYDQEKSRGLSNDVVDILNDLQSEYQFSLVEIASRRRYQSFDEKKVDMILFEDPRWGWDAFPHWTYESMAVDGTVYIALKDVAKKQSYFDTLTDKSIAGILGYHYGFANKNADETYLRSKFNISLVSHNSASVRLVLDKRVNLAAVTHSYIQLYLKENPSAAKALMVSEKWDQKYDLKFIINPKITIPKPRMTALMKELQSDKRYKKLISTLTPQTQTPLF
jgi:ABC-type amino acid transport substrate-binding protein